MPRHHRITSPGYHHVINRGVGRQNIFLDIKDKLKFKEILCETASIHALTIHAYVLMDNHYHLIVENKRNNLSDAMRQINAMYAQYFNKKYNRSGHLWQGRYKSWYIFDESYLFTLFKYIEYNPIKAGEAKKPGEFPFTLLYDVRNSDIPECMKDSFIFSHYSNPAKLIKSLSIPLSDKELEELEKFKKQASKLKEPALPEEKKPLTEYFKDIKNKKERNEAILKAYLSGYRQSEIASFLSLTDAAVSKIIKKLQ